MLSSHRLRETGGRSMYSRTLSICKSYRDSEVLVFATSLKSPR